jgi:peptidoglycan/LPS O-acetylase OafA/YrhL
VVIASHGVPAQVAPWLRAVGPHGVHVFFVISGFLITSKLLEEEALRGRISLVEFYLRRAFRILPPALVFLNVVAALGAAGLLAPMPLKEWLVDAFFLTSYVGRFPGRSPYTGHFWSLAVEEHFYLLFPFLLARAGSRRLRWLIPALLLAAPLWRWVDAAWVDLRGHAFPGVSPELRTDHVFDLLLYGCGLALLFRDERWREWFSRWLRTPALVVLAAALGVLVWREGPVSLEGLCIAGLLGGTVLHPEAPFGRVLELAPMQWIGRLSYSAYLWQQLFFVTVMREPEWPQRFPLNAVLLLAIALASYHLVEQLMIRLGRRVVARRRKGSARYPSAVTS